MLFFPPPPHFVLVWFSGFPGVLFVGSLVPGSSVCSSPLGSSGPVQGLAGPVSGLAFGQGRGLPLLSCSVSFSFSFSVLSGVVLLLSFVFFGSRKWPWSVCGGLSSFWSGVWLLFSAVVFGRSFCFVFVLFLFCFFLFPAPLVLPGVVSPFPSPPGSPSGARGFVFSCWLQSQFRVRVFWPFSPWS